MKAFHAGYISLEDAANILQRKTFGKIGTVGLQDEWKSFFSIDGKQTKDMVNFKARLFDKFFSNTKEMEQYLQELKKNKALYHRIVDNFDHPKIRHAISTDEPLSELVKIVDEVEKAHLKATNQASQAATEIAESIVESNSYKALNSQIESSLKSLRNNLKSASDAKKMQIQKQIDQLEHLKKNFAIGRTQEEIDQLFDIYKTFYKASSHKTIVNLDVIGKMLAKNLPELEEALKNFNLQKLRDLKQAGRFDDIGDEAFESVFKMLDKVKQMKNVNLLKY